jgi:lysophospholipase L1-like esterase
MTAPATSAPTKSPHPPRVAERIVNADMRRFGLSVTLVLALGSFSAFAAETAAPWVQHMQDVHTRFNGTNGTLGHFGDSITVTTAYWAPLRGTPKNTSPETALAHALVKRYLRTECWRDWKGADFGSAGTMTIRWAHENVDRWLTRLNPEAIVIMFGSNDVVQLGTAEYETKTREVVRRSLTNGTVVLLTTMPPRSGRLETARAFADAVRRIAREEQIPLIDYFGEILKRRPLDWDGGLPQFRGSPGNGYQVPTLIARDGVHPSNPWKFVNDFSEEALKTSGFTLRNYLTLLAYAEVIEKVLQAVPARGSRSAARPQPAAVAAPGGLCRRAVAS